MDIKSNDINHGISIILTTTVNTNRMASFQVDKQERIDTYLKAIKQWLTLTNLNIVVVENSGYLFEELNEELETYKNRFEIIVFDESKEKYQGHQMHLQSKGGLEINSIHFAYNKSNILNKSLFIIKITGRFYIYNFDIFLSKLNLDNYDCLKQHFNNRCEIVGTHIKNFDIIFNKNLFVRNGIYDYHVENVYDYRFSLFDKKVICPIFKIEPTKRGGLNEVYTQL